MVNAQLLEYVKSQLATGLSKETIYNNLTQAGGWEPVDINEAFSALGVATTVPLPQVSAVPQAPAPLKYAGFWVRFVAIMVDNIILSVVTLIISFIIGFIIGISGITLSTEKTYIMFISQAVSIIFIWMYFVLMTHYKGATLGKMLVGITVKTEELQKLSFGKILLRETIGKLVSTIILGIGYIVAGFTSKKQALHDKFAHSVVVYNNPSQSRTGLIIGIVVACILPAIAILGILSSVVLVSLNVARQKGVDAHTVASLSSIKLGAEVYYGKNNTYSVAKNCNSGVFLEQDFQKIFSDMKNKDVTCRAEGFTYAISAPLSEVGKSQCFDSSGFNGNGTAVSSNSNAYCAVNATTTSGTIMKTGIVSKESYSYTLPKGWEQISDNNAIEAVNRLKKFVLYVETKPLTQETISAPSITSVFNKDAIRESIAVQDKSAVIDSVEITQVGGVSAFVSKFNIKVNSPDTAPKKESIQQSLTQYNMFHKGNLYTMVFISSYDTRNEAQVDFMDIIASFNFKN